MLPAYNKISINCKVFIYMNVEMISASVETGLVEERVAMIKLEKGFAAKFPFELKDDFRLNFPSAQWNPKQKQWEVGPRTGKRLEQWVNVVKSNYSESVEEYESRLLSENELNKLLDKLKTLNKEIDAKTRLLKEVPESRREIEQALCLLEGRKQALANLHEEMNIQAESVKSEMNRIKEQLAPVVDIDQMKECAKKMGYSMGLHGQHHKDAFNDARAHIKEAQNRLRSAGLKLEAIDRLVDANKNRPDRDHPKYISEKMWFQLSECNAS
ncbi:MAG: hypothetical protein KGZ80_07095 [Methylomonas sp.]|nr:hypothetical protein [Methylomonas sp.]